MPSIVTAKPGDTLCNLAIAAGFKDCQPIRDEPGNAGKPFLDRHFLLAGESVVVPDFETKEEDKATDQEHVFELLSAPPVLVRFTHGSPNLPFRDDPDMPVLNVSNFPTDKGGTDFNQSFPTATKFDQRGHDDEDAFKIEVVDPDAPDKVEVLLQALKPVIAGGKVVKVAGVVQHEEFTGAEKSRREQKVTCELVKSKVCLRSPYLRLVVDEPDKNAAAGQTLLVTDMTDGKGGDNDAVEILDQAVRASYERPACPAGKKCTATVTAPIGTDHKRVKLALHILKDPDTGNALSNDEQVRRTLLMFMRQVYAQVNMSIKILGEAREVPAPGNMLVVDNREGRRAAGGKVITVRVEVDRKDGTKVDQTVSITTVANATCADTARSLAGAIRNVVPADLPVRDSPNPAIFGKKLGSADVLVGDPLSDTVRLTVLASNDARHPVLAAALTTAAFQTGDGNERHVGNINSRLLLKNYDTGRDRVDVFIVGNTPGVLGLAFNPFRKYTASYGHAPSNDEVANSFLVRAATLHAPGQPENFYTTIPHEIGHVLIDAIHVVVANSASDSRKKQLMGPGSPVGSNERVVNGPKRIADRKTFAFDENVRDIPAGMFRDNNTEVLTSFDDI